MINILQRFLFLIPAIPIIVLTLEFLQLFSSKPAAGLGAAWIRLLHDANIENTKK